MPLPPRESPAPTRRYEVTMSHDGSWGREYDADHAKRLVEEMAAKHAVTQEYLASFARADTLNVPALCPKPRSGTLALSQSLLVTSSSLSLTSPRFEPHGGIDHRYFLRPRLP